MSPAASNITPLQLGRRRCGPGCPPLMLAEEGQANDGDHALALHMIDLAADAGADGIEFQLCRADDMYIRSDPGHALYRRREFSADQIRALVERAHARDLIFEAACTSSAVVPMCVQAGADSFCVNAMDIDNPGILSAVADSGKPFWIATLMSTMADVDWAVEFVRRRGARSFGILHGQHIMTSRKGSDMPPDVMQLDCINLFQSRYGVPAGYVDHTCAVETPALAAMRGAHAVFKHLAPREEWRGPDWQVALPPLRWAASRAFLRHAVAMLGGTKEVGSLEAEDQPVHRRSVRAARDLPAGTVLAATDLAVLRPGGAMSPRQADRLVGRRLLRARVRDEQFLPSDVEGST